jgi:hypothetical protein
MHTKPRILLLAPWSTALGGWPGCGSVETRGGPMWTYSRYSPSTKCIAAHPPSPHAHQAPFLATGILEYSFRWLAGLWCSGNTGRTHVDPTRETHPSTKCIAAQPPSLHAHQAPFLHCGTLEHSYRWLAGLWCSGNKGRAYVDLLERHTHPRNV